MRGGPGANALHSNLRWPSAPAPSPAPAAAAADGNGQGGGEGRCAARGPGPFAAKVARPFILQPTSLAWMRKPPAPRTSPELPGVSASGESRTPLGSVLRLAATQAAVSLAPSHAARGPADPGPGRIGCGQSPRSRPAGPNAPAGLLSSGVPPESDVSGRQAALPLTSGATIPSAAAAVNGHRCGRK
jgi:hypothetical protein